MKDSSLRHVVSPAWPAIALFVVFCLLHLFQGIMTGNEATKLSEAMALADPDWIPGFLPDRDAGRPDQWLTQMLVAPLLRHGGFLITSIAGRIIGYGLLAFAITRIAAALSIRFVYLLVAVLLFDRMQSLAAHEWILRGFEGKVISYGLVLLALAWLIQLKGSPLTPALLLGLAISFHVLVGLYGTFAVGAVVIVQRTYRDWSRQHLTCAVLLFGAASAFAWPAIGGHLLNEATASAPEGGLSSSYIYVYLRAPHHLLPSAWASGWVVRLTAFGSLLAACWFRLRREPGANRLGLFVVMAVIPFFCGLAVAPFDHEGRLLQYYVFRFGDVMLPLGTCLLAAALVSRIPSGHRATAAAVTGWAAAASLLAAPSLALPHRLQQVRAFPGPAQYPPYPGLADGLAWIREQTPRDALFIVPPHPSHSFPWLTERRAVATFKQLGMSGGLQEWHRKMNALGAVQGPWPAGGGPAAGWLTQRYLRLTTEQATTLMDTYDADYFVTAPTHELALQSDYRDAVLVVYTRNDAPSRVTLEP